MRYTEPYRNAVELQRLIMASARAGDIKPLVLAGISRAFCELEETKRKLAMKPLPKPVDVADARKPKQPAQPEHLWTEPQPSPKESLPPS
jgi:hypothetical protein